MAHDGNRNTPLVLGVACASLGVTLPVALLAPAHFVTTYPILADYISICRSLVPGIDRLAAVSSFPEVTRLVISVMWTLVPVYMVLIVTKARIPATYWESLRSKRFFYTFCLFVAAVCVMLVAMLYEPSPADLHGGRLGRAMLRNVSTSRWALGIWSGIFLTGFAMMLALILLSIRNWRLIYLARHA